MVDFDINRREVYRLRYPLKERPAFDTGEEVFAVVDVSEYGLRFFTRKRSGYELGQQIEGELVLLENAGRRKLTGIVVRIDMGGVALQLHDDCPIPLAMMIAEQQRLIQKGVLEDWD